MAEDSVVNAVYHAEAEMGLAGRANGSDTDRPLGRLRQAVKRVERIKRVLSEIQREPGLWPVYGETVDVDLDDVARVLLDTIENYEEMREKCGRPGRSSMRDPLSDKPITRRGRQQYLRKSLWDTRPHICENEWCERRDRALTLELAEVAHIIPVFDSGPDDEGNVLLLCRNCHAQFEAGAVVMVGYRYDVVDNQQQRRSVIGVPECRYVKYRVGKFESAEDIPQETSKLRRDAVSLPYNMVRSKGERNALAVAVAREYRDRIAKNGGWGEQK